MLMPNAWLVCTRRKAATTASERTFESVAEQAAKRTFRAAGTHGRYLTRLNDHLQCDAGCLRVGLDRRSTWSARPLLNQFKGGGADFRRLLLGYSREAVNGHPRRGRPEASSQYNQQWPQFLEGTFEQVLPNETLASKETRCPLN